MTANITYSQSQTWCGIIRAKIIRLVNYSLCRLKEKLIYHTRCWTLCKKKILLFFVLCFNNWLFLRFRPLVRQNKPSEGIIFGSGKFQWPFFTIFWQFVDQTIKMTMLFVAAFNITLPSIENGILQEKKIEGDMRQPETSSSDDIYSAHVQ